MKIPCPKCSGTANKSGENIQCSNCGYSTDDFVVRRRNLATHRSTGFAAPDITKALPSRKVNGSRKE